jgi:hypothetical protein
MKEFKFFKGQINKTKHQINFEMIAGEDLITIAHNLERDIRRREEELRRYSNREINPNYYGRIRINQ